MGIPKFYRWLSERYPLLNMPVTATDAPPEIDNLYLDMNGIIHNCTHANDPTLKLTETEMVVRIFAYLDKLIQIMKPRRLVFLAIDGVAPRAKMNQQRARRFKSALERIALEEEKRARGEEETPEEYKFDSNCITPGTAFMARLGKHLRFFLRKKISEDPAWQAPVVIFSGHDVPGEGEHKIMEYIRWQKRSPGFKPNQRHCMYGLDADLIMLSLVTHEPHFCLLREVVSFTGRNRGQPARETLDNPCAENFILFQIGLLREYVELEFSTALGGREMPFALDAERVIDDIVLFCMLVGNDFLPAMPTLDIAEGALNKLIDTYKALLPTLGGYLTHAGQLNHERLQALLARVAEAELATLEERAADAEWFESKRSKRRPGSGRPAGGGGGLAHNGGHPSAAGPGLMAGGGAGGRGRAQQHVPMQHQQQQQARTFATASAFASLDGLGDNELDDGLAAYAAAASHGVAAAAPLVPELATMGALEEDGDAAGDGGGPGAEPTMMSREARALFLNGGGDVALRAWRERYYCEKLELAHASMTCIRPVVAAYLTGLHWVLQYYYRGVASWDWFYPHHYAPMAQDMVELDQIAVSFTRGRPFRPFEQLLAVLPAASAGLLPPAFRWLMCEPRSPVLDFYPTSFDVDLEGKRAEWEGIVKVPFIQEDRLLTAAASIPTQQLTAEERRRNVPGDMLVFEYVSGTHEASHCDSTLPKHFASVAQAHSSCRHVPPPEPLPDGEPGFVPALAKGTTTGKRNPPGFPTLKTMAGMRPELRPAGVTVFGSASKKDSLVLALPDVRDTLPGDAGAPLLRGMLAGRVYVKWPYLQEAEIVAVSDSKQRVGLSGTAQHTPDEAARWQAAAGQTKNAFLTKNGIDIGPLPIMLDVRVCTGHVRAADGSVRKEHAKELVPYPLQAVLQSRPRPPPGYADPDAPRALALTPGARAVWVGHTYFGAVATVLADPSLKTKGQAAGCIVRVQPLHRELLAAEARAHSVAAQAAPHYIPSGAAARSLRVNPRLLGRLTGNVWVDDSKGDRVDIGLAVKAAKQGLCVPHFCRPSPDGGAGWCYSQALVDLVRAYQARFPSMIAALARGVSGDEGGVGGASERQKLRASDLFPGVASEVLDGKLAEVRAWLKAQPSAKRPLVPVNAAVASDQAVERLQVLLPVLLPVGTTAPAAVELEQVHPCLLLPPHEPGGAVSVLAGGGFEPGDRVVVLRGTGSPAFGARGTVIGVLADAVEVLMDDEYAGGTTLGGRVRGPRGGYLPPEQLLNVSKQAPVRGVGQAPRAMPKNAALALMAASTAGTTTGSDGTTVISPSGAATAVVTRMVELAPWLRGSKAAQHLAAAAQQQRALMEAEARTPDTTPTMPAAGAAGAAQIAAPSAAAAPSSKQQGGQLLQMLQKRQGGPSASQQQQLPRPMMGGAAGGAPAVPAAPAVPPSSAGASLLLRLKTGAGGSGSSAGGGNSSVGGGGGSGAPAPGAAGAQLLAMLQRGPVAAAPPKQQPQQQQEDVVIASTLTAQHLEGKLNRHPTATNAEQAPAKAAAAVLPPQMVMSQQHPAPSPSPTVPAATQAAPPPRQAEAAVPRTPTPPRGAAGAAAAAASSDGGAPQGERAAPRTPPAGAGSSLLARGSGVIMARLPDKGGRGFAMGRGQRLPSSSGGGGGMPGTPPAPGSSSGGGGGGRGGYMGTPPAPSTLLDLELRSNGVAGPRGPQHDVLAPAARNGSDGAALMRLLQQGSSGGSGRSVSPPPPPPATAPVQALAEKTAAAPVASASAPQDAMTAANTGAAMSLLRRLQLRTPRPQ